MTRFTFRPDTMDFAIFNMVYFQNEYQLPSRFAPDDIVIDIGAHIGSFAFAALVRGAGRVISIEAHPANYQLARRNLTEYIENSRLDLRWGAVWRSDDHHDNLTYSDFTAINDHLINTGSVEVHVSDGKRSTPLFALDDVISDHKIRLLKLDCEGAEFPILLTSKHLHQVEEIVGEFHEFGGNYDQLQTTFHLPHYKHYTVDVLLDFLQSQGFSTDYQRHHRYNAGEWIPLRLGYFRAKRLDKIIG